MPYNLRSKDNNIRVVVKTTRKVNAPNGKKKFCPIIDDKKDLPDNILPTYKLILKYYF